MLPPASQQTVWILGAGASRALGGPLLSDLFSKASAEIAHERYGAPLTCEDWTPLRVATLYGLGSRTVVTASEDMYAAHATDFWDHAEEFLECIDRAHDKPEGVEAFKIRTIADHLLERPNTKDGFKALRTAALRLLAAECTLFMDGTDREDERWLPYVRWARRLSNSDTILSFNYDLVLEALVDDPGRNARIEVVIPGKEREISEFALALKLHGSLDWRIAGGQIEKADAAFALSASPDEMALATPGPTKTAFVKKHLRQHWDAAMEAVKTAQRIVFCGYQFPPTDAYTRGRILRAISENVDCESVDIVLGRAGDGARVASLVKPLIRQVVVDEPGPPVEPRNLGAEEFFDQEFLARKPPAPLNAEVLTSGSPEDYPVIEVE